MDKKILIIEDDTDISKLVASMLENNGYITDCAYSGTEALMLLEKNDYGLIISDLMLPGISGEEIVKKTGDRIPIIIVSAKIGIDDKVNNLMNGAVDYITKPFSPEELLARVAVQIRRSNAPSAAGNDKIYIDKGLNTAFADGIPLRLTKTEFALLKIFLDNSKRIFSKSQLLDAVSDKCDVWESSINVHICNLRKKLFDASGENYIEAVWGIGYRFLPDKKS